MSNQIKDSRRNLIKKLLSLGAGALLPTLVPTLAQAQTRLRSVRLVHQESQRLFLDLDAMPVDARVFLLDNPKRLVIDLADCALDETQQALSFQGGVVSQVRFGVQAGRHLRVVFDLRDAVKLDYEFIKRPEGRRMVVDLGVAGNPTLAAAAPTSSPQTVAEPVRPLVVAIDAGHGGRDPGAIGTRQTREKDITLDVARRLFKYLQAESGIAPVLVRDKDEYIGLRERLKIAREARADLFVSIHADAVPRKEAKGSSVYALSLKGASSETAQWLADQENQSELFGDVTLQGLSRDLQQTLIELAQNSTLESSFELAAHVLAELDRIGPLHKNTVELANFAVLKSPDIPSILVETAFISNPGEERKLNSKRYRDKLARSLRNGIMNYLHLRAPAGSLLARQKRSASG